MDRLGTLFESRISELESVTDHVVNLSIDELRTGSDGREFRSCHRTSIYPLPPPLLTENDRQVMAEFRRLAVKCENTLKICPQRGERSVVSQGGDTRDNKGELLNGVYDDGSSSKSSESCTLPVSSWSEDPCSGMHPRVCDSQDTLVMAASIQSLPNTDPLYPPPPPHSHSQALGGGELTPLHTERGEATTPTPLHPSVRRPTPLECEASPRFASTAPSRRGVVVGGLPISQSQELLMQTAVQFQQLKHQLAHQQKLQLHQLLDLQKQEQHKLQQQIDDRERSLLAQYQRLADQHIHLHQQSAATTTVPSTTSTSPYTSHPLPPPNKQLKRHSTPALDVITSPSNYSPTPLLTRNHGAIPSPRNYGDVRLAGKENSPAYTDRPIERTYRFKEHFIYYDRLAAEQDNKWKFDLITAVAKSFLLRTLMRTDRVKILTQTIRDSREFLVNMNVEGEEATDTTLQRRVTAQLQSAMFELHDVLFNYSTEEQMYQINRSRVTAREKHFKSQENSNKSMNKAPLSAATQKVLERKRQASDKPNAVGPRRKSTEWRPGQTVSRGQKTPTSEPNKTRAGRLRPPTHLTVKSRSPRPKSPKPDRKKLLKTTKT